MVRLYTLFVCFILPLAVFLSSCQKDENVDAAKADPQTRIDSAEKLNNTAGNYLAGQGTLKIKLADSTYTFDASKDSIAFVNISIAGTAYYGITAINKAHTVSFGISTQGSPVAEIPGNVSGCQFLLHAPGKTDLEYTLTRNTAPGDYGTLSLDKYNQDTLLAKGTFHTYLAINPNKSSSFIDVDGTLSSK
jgi:hypothetical protein